MFPSNVSPAPTLIVFVEPLRVMDEEPIVRIPTIRAFPSTKSAVLPIPIVTVPIPFETARNEFPCTVKSPATSKLPGA